MSIPKTQFIAADVELDETEIGYQGFFRLERLKLRHKLFRGGWSQWFYRELFVRGDAVAAILYDPVADLIGFVEQFYWFLWLLVYISYRK